MAKKTNKKWEEPVTICDQLEKSDNILSQSEIESLILTIRGHQVLIDRDLADLFGVKTKRLNEQVKRNLERCVGSLSKTQTS